MRCLVIQTAFIGDVILTTPLLRLAGGLPDVSWLGAVVTPTGAALLRGQGIVDDIVEYDKRGHDRGLRGLFRAATGLRRLDVDAALVPHRSFRSALLATLARAPERVGFAASGGRAFLTRALPYERGAHEAERIAGLVTGIGGRVPEGRLPLELGVPPRGDEELDRILSAERLEARAGLVVVAPGSRWRTKRWPPERFAEVASVLAREFALGIVLSGDESDTTAAREVGRRISSPLADLSGRLSIAAWVALIARARLLISNDSAAAHVAAAVGTPVVAVFGPTVPAQGFAPYSERSRVAEADLDCRPCGRHGGGRCPLGTLACMLDVPPDAVIDRARELLRAGAER